MWMPPALPVHVRGQEKEAFPVSPSLLAPLSLSWLHSQNWLTITGGIWSVNKRFLGFKNKDQVLEIRAWKRCVNYRKSIKGGRGTEIMSHTGQERFWRADDTACSWKRASGGGMDMMREQLNRHRAPLLVSSIHQDLHTPPGMRQVSKTDPCPAPPLTSTEMSG